MSHHVFVHLSDAERTALRQGEAQARLLAERNRFRVVLFSDSGNWMRSFVTHQHPFKTIKDLEVNPTMIIQRIHKFVPVLVPAE